MEIALPAKLENFIHAQVRGGRVSRRPRGGIHRPTGGDCLCGGRILRVSGRRRTASVCGFTSGRVRDYQSAGTPLCGRGCGGP